MTQTELVVSLPKQLMLMLMLMLISQSLAADPLNGIHVTGRGTLEIPPDMGYVTLNVRREGSSAETLKSELDAVVREVLALTRRLSIAARDVTATAVRINPRHRRRDNETVVDGLVATRTINVTLRDLDRFGDLLNESLALGINNVQPMRLDSSERDELEDQALDLAMEDARQEAARIAAGFSVPLGPVTNVQASGHSPRPQEFVRAAAMADSGGDFSAGVIRIERSLQVTFAIPAAN